MELRVSDNDNVRKGLEYGGQDKSLVHFSPVCILQARRGLAWPGLVTLYCKHGAFRCMVQVPSSWGKPHSHAAICFSLAIKHADVKGFDSCQPWLGAGHRYVQQQGVEAGAGAMWCLSPMGSSGTLHFGISFRFFLADFSFEFSRPAVLLYYLPTTYLSHLPPLLPAFLPLVACSLLNSCPLAKTSHSGRA